MKRNRPSPSRFPFLACACLVALAAAGCATRPASVGPQAGANRLDTAGGSRVLTGLDVLQREDFARLKGQRVALIGNHSSINREGVHLLDLLRQHPNVELVALFSPEHGFRGTADEHVADGVHEQTGLPIFSLYGATRVPTDAMLPGIDTVVFDMQDIGARFYTYISTMGEFMRKAQEHNIRFIVLDRPNPIQGNWFDGAIQDTDLVGRFTSFRPMPIAHGMTIGEMARMYWEFDDIRPELEIVPMEGWRRDMYFDETGLPWVNPSPNMRSVDEELLYTMIALTEGNRDLSVGRGTDRPFEYLGAPWVDGERLTRNMNERRLPGLWFMHTTFVPSPVDITGRPNVRYPFTGEVCNGFRVVITDRHTVSPVAAGIHMLDALLEIHPDRYRIDQLRGLLGAQWVMDALNERQDPDEIVRRWRESPEFMEFAQQRRQVLLY
jgi:uncharacterized protein YbbC (DUF1343 family)